MASAFLDDRGVLSVSGEEARSFLQGLVTCNMDKVSPEAAGFGALLSPQGKILFDFLIVEEPEGFLIETGSDAVSALLKRLSMYRLRAKVTLEERPDLGVVALWDGATSEGLVFDDPRHAGLGRRAILPRLEAQAHNHDDYETHRILCGVPKGGLDFAYGEAFPHDADMDLIHGLDFKKGCYIGQEVVSRVEHRGTARKRIVPIALRGPAPAPGTEIRAGDIAIGTMGSATSAGRALAMIRLDKAEEALANATPLIAGGAIVELLPAHMVRA